MLVVQLEAVPMHDMVNAIHRPLARPCDSQFMTSPLRNDTAVQYEALLEGKLPRNMSWSAALDLVGELGTVEPHGDHDFVFTVGEQRAFFKRPHDHQLGVEEVARLRKFLRDAGPVVDKAVPVQPCRMIVEIDHHGAHVFRNVDHQKDDVVKLIRPDDPFGFHHHLIHRKEAHYRGERVPEEASFYEEISRELLPANQIVLIGSGTGKSSAVDHLAHYLAIHHPSISRHVVATEKADLSALTSPEIEAIARQHAIAVV